MSEYQYYEFLAIDRPLGTSDLAYVRSLSRRVQPTPTQAVFTYSYGDFPGEPLHLLATHYDMMLYLANWGANQLAFRFPKTAIDQAAFQTYYYGVDQIEVTTIDEYVILNIASYEEEGTGWISEESHLAPLVPLRDALMRDDLRVLYLAWLASASRGDQHDRVLYYGDDDEYDEEPPKGVEVSVAQADPTEPPVPPGLGQLNGALQTFIDFFNIDPDLVGAAAENSPPLQAASEPIDRWVTLLPEAEQQAFLVRAAQGDLIGAELLRRLRVVGGVERPAPSSAPRRTISELQTVAEVVKRNREARERRAAEQARLAELEALGRREAQVWAEVPLLLAKRTASGYDQAVAHLVSLRDLAAHRGQQAQFAVRLDEIIAPYATSNALQRRLKEQRMG